MTDLEALWRKLRADPDFDPEWLKFMGPMPPTDKPITQWGDGHADMREHVIEDIAFGVFGLLGWVKCRCGALIQTDTGNAVLKQLWDLHRGNVSAREEAFASDSLATDDDVADFLSRVSDASTSYSPTQGFMQGGVPVVNDEREHYSCQHGDGGYCLVAYSALRTVIDHPELVPAL